MNPVLMISQLLRRIKFYQSFNGAYRGSLITTASWKTDKGLTALLCGGVGVMVFTTCLQLGTKPFDADTHALSLPPQRLATQLPAKQALPEIAIKIKNIDTLFQLNKQNLLERPPPKQSAEPKKPDQTAPIPLRNTRQWQLQIYRPPISDALMLGAIDDAQKQLQSGQVSLARQAFLAVLTHDTHSVEAMEGMLLVSRQLGDSKSEEEYLEMLRQEIPDYTYENVSGNDVFSVSDQD